MMKTYTLRYLPSARDDLQEIAEYISVDGPISALRFLKRLDKSIEKLCQFPFLGNISREKILKAMGYRKLVVGYYTVFYVVLGNVIEVRRILHCARDLSDFL